MIYAVARKYDFDKELTKISGEISPDFKNGVVVWYAEADTEMKRACVNALREDNKVSNSIDELAGRKRHRREYLCESVQELGAALASDYGSLYILADLDLPETKEEKRRFDDDREAFHKIREIYLQVINLPRH